MKNKLKNRSFVIVAIIVLVTGIILVQKRQYIISRALTPSSTGEVTVETTTTDAGYEKIRLLFRTGSDLNNIEAISTVSLKMSLPNVKNVLVTNEFGDEIYSIQVNEQLVNGGEWVFPVNHVFYEEGEMVVEFSAVNTSVSGYSSIEHEELATFYLKGVANRAVKFAFDEEMSNLYSKRRPVTDIWE